MLAESLCSGANHSAKTTDSVLAPKFHVSMSLLHMRCVYCAYPPRQEPCVLGPWNIYQGPPARIGWLVPNLRTHCIYGNATPSFAHGANECPARPHAPHSLSSRTLCLLPFGANFFVHHPSLPPMRVIPATGYRPTGPCYSPDFTPLLPTPPWSLALTYPSPLQLDKGHGLRFLLWNMGGSGGKVPWLFSMLVALEVDIFAIQTSPPYMQCCPVNSLSWVQGSSGVSDTHFSPTHTNRA